MSDPVARKYALTKVKAGDYLLPSNDTKTLWRISRYTDGPSMGLEGLPADREFWGVWRWNRPLTEGGYVDTAAWELWEMERSMYDTRGEAVRAALGAGE